MAEHHTPSDLGQVVARVGCLVLGVTFILFGLFEFLIAQLMGPGNSDELVSGGPVVVPWFLLPAVAMGAAGVAIAQRRRLGFAYGALGVTAACLAAWFALAYFISD
jgi:hypothetical protein